jgi:hypothetical protein
MPEWVATVWMRSWRVVGSRGWVVVRRMMAAGESAATAVGLESGDAGASRLSGTSPRRSGELALGHQHISTFVVCFHILMFFLSVFHS